MSHRFASGLAFVAIVCGFGAPLPARADFFGANWLTAKDCTGLAPTQDCATRPIIAQLRNNARGTPGSGAAWQPPFPYGLAMGSAQYTCPGLFTGVNGAVCPFTFPQLKASTNAASNARLNSNNVAMQTYQYTGSLPTILPVTASFSFTSSGGTPGVAGEGTVWVVAYILDYKLFYSAVSTEQGIFNTLLSNLDCGAPGVLAVASYNAPQGSRGGSSFSMNFRNCSGGFPNFTVQPNQAFILGAALQAPSSRGGWSDASHTLTFELDPDADPVVLANLEKSLTNDVQDLPPVAAAIEFYHAGFDHYFVTSIPDEVTKLDNGTFAGWVRTGKSFNVGAPGTQDVCRFFSTSFGAKSSHFYTALASECDTVKNNKDWQFEGPVFTMALPDAAGTCPSGTVPVYRLYNNGQGGAPNHRLTIDATVRTEMLNKGWIAEGSGAAGVGMCAPA